MRWWDRWRGKRDAGPKAPDAGQGSPPEQPSAIDLLCDRSAAARLAYWSRIGRVDDDVIGQLMASRFLGDTPVWPSGRERFLVIRKAKTTILATDGLSDPDDDAYRETNGHRIELYIEAPAAQLENPIGSPYLQTLTQMSRNVAHHGDWFGSWERWQLLSIDLPTWDARMTDAEGRQALLLGMPGFDQVGEMPGMPLSPVKAMAVTVVHPADFATVADDVTSSDRDRIMAGRRRLADALMRQGVGAVSDLDRAPLA